MCPIPSCLMGHICPRWTERLTFCLFVLIYYMSIEDREAKIRQWVEDMESGSDFSAGSEDDYIPSGVESDSETGVSVKARNEAPVTDDEELSGD